MSGKAVPRHVVQVYYVVGLAPEASRFFYFMLMLFLVHTMGISMFRAIAGLARDESIAITGGSFFFLVSPAPRYAPHPPRMVVVRPG